MKTMFNLNLVFLVLRCLLFHMTLIMCLLKIIVQIYVNEVKALIIFILVHL